MTPIIENFNMNILIWAVIIHLVIDWLLQNEWMAVNKTDLRHPAAYVHSGLHVLGLLLVFPWYLALGVGIAHLIIDTRHLVNWWMKHIKRMPRALPTYTEVEIWMDQIFHLVVLVTAVFLL